MLIQYSTLVLASQLLIAAADNVPKFNVERGCKASLSRSDETICVQDEKKALDQIQSLWPQVAPSDRTVCIGEATNVSDVPPSYVELLICLEMQQSAKKLKG
jgi:hypothetical protein